MVGWRVIDVQLSGMIMEGGGRLLSCCLIIKVHGDDGDEKEDRARLG